MSWYTLMVDGLTRGKPVWFPDGHREDGSGFQGTVVSVEREDGSGLSFNVVCRDGAGGWSGGRSCGRRGEGGAGPGWSRAAVRWHYGGCVMGSVSVRADAVAFFREHGPHSVAPGETDEQGRERSARELADAEAWLVAQPGFTVQWLQDNDYDPADYDVPGMPDVGWGCIVRCCGGEQQSLWAITFDGDGHPDGHPYARVVVAELASELMPD